LSSATTDLSTALSLLLEACGFDSLFLLFSVMLAFFTAAELTGWLGSTAACAGDPVLDDMAAGAAVWPEPFAFVCCACCTGTSVEGLRVFRTNNVATTAI